MSFSLAGKIALVTGANRGIGKAIVEAFFREGAAKIYLAVREPGSAEALVKLYGDKAVAVHVDVSRPESITALAKVAKDVQVLVNNAGVLTSTGPLDPKAEEALRYEMEVNTYGLLRMAQAFAPYIVRNGGGALIQLNSVASLKNMGGGSTYSISKAASYSLTQGLRDALAPQGVRVLSVHPGPTLTDMAVAGGIEHISEPVTVVPDAILAALKTDAFHCFAGTMARAMGEAYHGYAQAMIEPGPAVE